MPIRSTVSFPGQKTLGNLLVCVLPWKRRLGPNTTLNEVPYARVDIRFDLIFFSFKKVPVCPFDYITFILVTLKWVESVGERAKKPDATSFSVDLAGPNARLIFRPGQRCPLSDGSDDWPLVKTTRECGAGVGFARFHRSCFDHHRGTSLSR